MTAAQQCRQKAALLTRLAEEATDPSAKAGFEDLAHTWDALADEAEARCRAEKDQAA